MQERLVPPDERWWPGVADLLRRFAESGRRDLRRVTVIVPRMAHAAALRTALVEAWPGVAFVGPRTTTLEDFAGIERLARWRQRAELFDALRDSDWVRDTFGTQPGMLWALARDVAALSDELTLAASGAVDAFAGRWTQAVQRHFSRRAAQLGATQAQFVLALWRATLTPGGGAAHGAALLRERLEARAGDVRGPLVWLVPQGAAPWQRAVCEAMAKRSGQPAILVGADRPALVQRHGWVGAAWPEVLDEDAGTAAEFAPLAERAAALRCASPGDSPVAPGFFVYKTSTLEEEATAAARWTLEWLQRGARRIALVALDRLTARRVRALLERAQVPVRDESGWKLSTTSACAVVIHWLDLATPEAVPQGAAPWQRAVCEAITERSGQPAILVAADRHALARRHGWIGAAWPEILDDDAGVAEFAPLAERAAALLCAFPDPSAAPRFAAAPAIPGFFLYKTSTLEEEATAAARWTLDRLQQGAQHVALVALDRLTARRVRALLERAQVSVHDDSGWKLSTTSACAVVIHWLDLAAPEAVPQDRLDWLQSPFAAGARDRIEFWIARAQPGRDASGTEHLRDLRAALRDLGVEAALAVDRVGAAVLDALDRLQDEWRDFDLRLRPAEFRAFLAAYFEEIGTDVDTGSPVLMTSLAGTRLRRFDAALLIGADADHLPGTSPPGVLMAPAVRRDLGLPGMETMRREQTLDLACLLATTPAVAGTWRSRRVDEPVALSPLLDRLDRLLRFLPNTAPRMGVFALEWRPVAAWPLRPRAPRAALPRRISAGAAQDLVDCPYRFFALRALGLAERERPRETPDKRDLGTLMHQVLYEFHHARDGHAEAARRGVLPTPAVDRAALHAVVDAQFAPRLAERPALIAYRERIKSWIPGYVAWLHREEAKGWRWRSGESSLRRTFAFGEGDADSGSVELLGRIDRIDSGCGGAVRIIDYKTRSPGASRKAQRDLGEDVQLAFYGLLLDEPGPVQAAYLHLERPDDPAVPEDGVVHMVDVEPAGYAEQITVLRARLRTDLARIAAGAPLPANGAESVCRRCELRSLCRHGFFSPAGISPAFPIGGRGREEAAS